MTMTESVNFNSLNNQVYPLYTSPTGIYSYPSLTFNQDLSYCLPTIDVVDYQVINSNGYTGPASSAVATIQTCDSSSGPCMNEHVNIWSSNYASKVTFKLRSVIAVAGGSSISHDSPDVNVFVECSQTQTTIDLPFATEQEKIIKQGDTANNWFDFERFTCSTSTCCQPGGKYLSYKIRDSAQIPSASETWTSLNIDPTVIDVGGNKMRVNIADVTIVGNYSFYIFATNDGQDYVIKGAEVWSEKVNLKIVCTPTSTTINWKKQLNGLDVLQEVPANDVQKTKFILNPFTFTEPNCPVEKINIVKTNDINALHWSSAFASASLTDVAPLDISADQTYQFW